MDKVATKGRQLLWVANTIVVDQPAWKIIEGEISHHDTKVKSKLWIEFVYALIMPPKNDQRVHDENAIVFAF